MLLSGIGILTAMSGAAVILTGNSGGPAVLLVIVAGYLVGSAAWRRTRELLEPTAKVTEGDETALVSSSQCAKGEVLLPTAAKAGASA